MKKNTSLNEDGINGLGIGKVDVDSKEFKELQRMIADQSGKQSKKKVLDNKLMSLRFQMENYLNEQNPKLLEVGWFLKEFLKELNIKNKVFAEYIEFQESNLSALIRGNRKINPDLALKLGKIFRVDPSLWIHIQSKNELLRIQEENKNQYQKYSIDDLLKKAS